MPDSSWRGKAHGPTPHGHSASGLDARKSRSGRGIPTEQDRLDVGLPIRLTRVSASSHQCLLRAPQR